MNPQPSFCPNLACPSRGKVGAGNLRVHDRLRDRWKCRTCRKTFSGRKGTALYGLRSDPATFVLVVTLLAYGCPLPAIVAAFGLDARTVADWQQRAGAHCRAVHEAVVQTPQDLGSVQADEMCVRLQKRVVVWLAMAVCAKTRLWLGAEIGRDRSTRLLRTLAARVKACANEAPLLVVTDGWRAYREAFLKAFRISERTGKRGQPRRLPCPGFVLAQTVKWTESGRTLGIRVCHLFGASEQVARLLPKEQVLSTAYIERLNATFRQRLAGLHRRTRCLRAKETAFTDAVFLVGTVYNFCSVHRSLSETAGQSTTPVMAAGKTRHVWEVGELMAYHRKPPPFVPPKKRGRKHNAAQRKITA